MKYCEMCGKEFEPYHRNQKACSEKCRQEAENKQRREKAAQAASTRKRGKLSGELLNEDSRQADAAGMSYGKWRALVAAREENK